MILTFADSRTLTTSIPMMNDERVIAGMAMLPERGPYFDDVWERIKPQVDKLFLSVNNGMVVPPIAKTDDKIQIVEWRSRSDDARKFAGLWDNTGDFYFFSMDDDLLYPTDYVDRMVRFIRYWDNEILACVHGSWIEELPCESYYHDKKAVHFAHPLDEPKQVMFPGTGTAAWHSAALSPGETKYPIRNIADVQTGLAANYNDVPVLAIPRNKSWINQHPAINALEDSIWANRKDADEDETDLINGFQESVGWGYPSLPSQGSPAQAE